MIIIRYSCINSFLLLPLERFLGFKPLNQILFKELSGLWHLSAGSGLAGRDRPGGETVGDGSWRFFLVTPDSLAEIDRQGNLPGAGAKSG